MKSGDLTNYISTVSYAIYCTIISGNVRSGKFSTKHVALCGWKICFLMWFLNCQLLTARVGIMVGRARNTQMHHPNPNSLLYPFLGRGWC